MYLSDREINGLLDEIQFLAEEPGSPFQPDIQVQPASIDLRLGSVFWKQTTAKPLDLQRSYASELAPSHGWQRRILTIGESLVIRPKEMVLARTNEEFSIPLGCAGKLEGRSSFARLGLMIHCAGDFINPGWRGRMPLQLVNLSRRPIKVAPGIALCQLILVRLTSEPILTYGGPDVASTYMNDQGGPSQWWRDRMVRDLRDLLGEARLPDGVLRDVIQFIGTSDAAIIERFEDFLVQTPVGRLTNAYDLLDRFAEGEDFDRRKRRLLRTSERVLPLPIIASVALASLLDQPYGIVHYALWATAVMAALIFVHSFFWDIGGHLGKAQLGHLRNIQSG